MIIRCYISSAEHTVFVIGLQCVQKVINFKAIQSAPWIRQVVLILATIKHTCTLRWGLSSCGLHPLNNAATIIKQLLQPVAELPAADLRWGRASLQNNPGSTKQPASSALDTTLKMNKGYGTQARCWGSTVQLRFEILLKFNSNKS